MDAYDSVRAAEVLKDRFGHSGFRPHQEDLIRAVLRGDDALALMATGSGKSLTFQFPGQYMKTVLHRSGSTVVVSPLLSLMEDQTAGLASTSIRACALNSNTPSAQIWNDAQNGLYDLIYTTPEMIVNRTAMFADMHRRGLINLIAVDEAHCVSEWGCDFRPDYRRLAVLRDQLPLVPILALTATATPCVRDDIISVLKLHPPPGTTASRLTNYRGGAGNTARSTQVIVSTFNRPNLHYTVWPRSNKMEYDIGRAIKEIERQVGKGAVIIYCNTQKQTEELCACVQKLAASSAAVTSTSAGTVAAPAASSSSSAGAAVAISPASSSTGGWETARVSPVPSSSIAARALPTGLPRSNSNTVQLTGAGAGAGSVLAAQHQQHHPRSPASVASTATAASPLAHIKAAFYHAGMTPEDRKRVHHSFLSDRINVVCATVAFGMGIDKKDVRGIIHYGMPKSLESYYQQTGRAGRDAEPSRCIMFWNHADFSSWQSMLGHAGSASSPPSETRQALPFFAFSSPASMSAGAAAIAAAVAPALPPVAAHYSTYSAQDGQLAMKKYVLSGSSSCKRRLLLEYFGELVPLADAATSSSASAPAYASGVGTTRDGRSFHCDGCDACDANRAQSANVSGDGAGSSSSSSPAQPATHDFGPDFKLLASAIDFGGNSSLTAIIKVLRGSDSEEIRKKFRGRHTQAECFGKGRYRSEGYWKSISGMMVGAGCLEIRNSSFRQPATGQVITYTTYTLTPRGRELIVASRYGSSSSSSSSSAAPRIVMPIPEDLRAVLAPQHKHYPAASAVTSSPSADAAAPSYSTSNNSGNTKEFAGAIALAGMIPLTILEEQLYTAIETVRRDLADDLHIGAVNIMTNRMMRWIAKLRPRSLDALKAIDGFDEHKTRTFGPAIIKRVVETSSELGLATTDDRSTVARAAGAGAGGAGNHSAAAGASSSSGVVDADPRAASSSAASSAGEAHRCSIATIPGPRLPSIAADREEFSEKQLELRMDSWTRVVHQGHAVHVVAADKKGVKNSTILGHLCDVLGTGMLADISPSTYGFDVQVNMRSQLQLDVFKAHRYAEPAAALCCRVAEAAFDHGTQLIMDRTAQCWTGSVLKNTVAGIIAEVASVFSGKRLSWLPGQPDAAASVMDPMDEMQWLKERRMRAIVDRTPGGTPDADPALRSMYYDAVRVILALVYVRPRFLIDFVAKYGLVQKASAALATLPPPPAASLSTRASAAAASPSAAGGDIIDLDDDSDNDDVGGGGEFDDDLELVQDHDPTDDGGGVDVHPNGGNDDELTRAELEEMVRLQDQFDATPESSSAVAAATSASSATRVAANTAAGAGRPPFHGRAVGPASAGAAPSASGGVIDLSQDDDDDDAGAGGGVAMSRAASNSATGAGAAIPPPLPSPASAWSPSAVAGPASGSKRPSDAAFGQQQQHQQIQPKAPRSDAALTAGGTTSTAFMLAGRPGESGAGSGRVSAPSLSVVAAAPTSNHAVAYDVVDVTPESLVQHILRLQLPMKRMDVVAAMLARHRSAHGSELPPNKVHAALYSMLKAGQIRDDKPSGTLQRVADDSGAEVPLHAASNSTAGAHRPAVFAHSGLAVGHRTRSGLD